jgi:hypothetical protein
LVRSPQQQHLDKGEEKEGISVPVRPFQSGYVNASMEQLRGDLTRRVPETRGFLSSRMFAVLDQRSAQDKTVLISRLVTTWPDDVDDEDPVALEASKIETWKVWRVGFLAAANMVSMCEEKSGVVANEMTGPEFYDEHGVFQLPGVEVKSDA